jgi:hypothetical protein
MNYAYLMLLLPLASAAFALCFQNVRMLRPVTVLISLSSSFICLLTSIVALTGGAEKETGTLLEALASSLISKAGA